MLSNDNLAVSQFMDDEKGRTAGNSFPAFRPKDSVFGTANTQSMTGENP